VTYSTTLEFGSNAVLFVLDKFLIPNLSGVVAKARNEFGSLIKIGVGESGFGSSSANAENTNKKLIKPALKI
jgi:hypothetical protein